MISAQTLADRDKARFDALYATVESSARVIEASFAHYEVHDAYVELALDNLEEQR